MNESSPPIAMLYGHVRESICAFFTLEELAVVMCVSQDWKRSVAQAGSIQWRIKCGGSFHAPTMKHIRRHQLSIQSAPILQHHVISIDWSCSAIASHHHMEWLHQHFRRLQTLKVRLDLSTVPSSPWRFPTSLTCLDLQVYDDDTEDKRNDLMASIAALHGLVDLTLRFSKYYSLRPLLALSHLRRLEVPEGVDVHALRQMHQLHELIIFLQPFLPDAWPLILRPGHQLQLRTIRLNYSGSLECAALASMPSLTDVTLDRFTCGTDDLAFFGALTQLTRLDIGGQSLMLAKHLIHYHLPHLTDLTVRSWRDCCQEDDHWHQLPQLRKLTLSTYEPLVSLNCFGHSRGGLNRTLLSLTIIGKSIPCMGISELAHLHSLQALESLALVDLFDSEPTLAETAPFRQSMPALRTLTFS
jgi:hypothetical protein